MNNKQLAAAYAQHNLIFRDRGGRTPHYTLTSLDYLPSVPCMSVFSRPAVEEVENRVMEFRAQFGQPSPVTDAERQQAERERRMRAEKWADVQWAAPVKLTTTTLE